MGLIKIENKMPIKAIPEETLNKFILVDFAGWVARLLSLTDEKSAGRLEVALPAIKEHCWSMGFDEIKKMFEMYADNKLSVKPMPNYFDRILFGQIVQAYKEQKPRPKPQIEQSTMTEADKEHIITVGIITAFEYFKEHGSIESGKTWVYDHFRELGKLPKHTKEFRAGIIERAKAELETEYLLNPDRDTGIEKFRIQIQKEGTINVRCKEIILRDYFRYLTDNKIDIKNEF